MGCGQAVIRFSRWTLPVVGVLAVTGLSRALDLAGGWRGLVHTGFGRVLDLKLLLFAGLLLLAATAIGCCLPWPDQRAASTPCAAASPVRLP